MTLIEAFPLFLGFVVSFFLVNHYSSQFGILQWLLAIMIGCALFAIYVGIRVVCSVLRAQRRKMDNVGDNPEKRG